MVDIGDGEYVVRQSHNYRLCCQYHRGRTRTARCDDRLPRTLPHRLSSHSGNFALRMGVADMGTLSWGPSASGRGWILLNFSSFTPSLARVSNVIFEGDDLRGFAGNAKFYTAARNAVVGDCASSSELRKDLQIPV